jgi:hypothetical protein
MNVCQRNWVVGYESVVHGYEDNVERSMLSFSVAMVSLEMSSDFGWRVRLVRKIRSLASSMEVCWL